MKFESKIEREREENELNKKKCAANHGAVNNTQNMFLLPQKNASISLLYLIFGVIFHVHFSRIMAFMGSILVLIHSLSCAVRSMLMRINDVTLVMEMATQR